MNRPARSPMKEETFPFDLNQSFSPEVRTFFFNCGHIIKNGYEIATKRKEKSGRYNCGKLHHMKCLDCARVEKDRRQVADLFAKRNKKS